MDSTFERLGESHKSPLPASAHRLGHEVLIEERPVLSRRLLYHQR